MNILLSSYFFFPSIGGLETVTSILAHEFVHLGHTVKLVTQTPSNETDNFPFEVIRQPAPRRLLNLVHWCDVYLQNNISLLLAWPLLLIRRPWVVVHQTWLSRGLRGRLKKMLLRYATGISNSHAVAATVPTSITIANPYCDKVFYERPDVALERDLVFVGRLIADKGTDLLLHALGNLRSHGLRLTLTIVGSGPEEATLRLLVRQLGLDDQVRFVGVQQGNDLARLLNAHRVMVVPSIWPEPFGVVALEGIASGCIGVGSEGGGLAEAIGSCGVTFPNGDLYGLTSCLVELFTHPEHWPMYRANAASHLAQHTPETVATAYLDVLEGVCH